MFDFFHGGAALSSIQYFEQFFVEHGDTVIFKSIRILNVLNGMELHIFLVC